MYCAVSYFRLQLAIFDKRVLGNRPTYSSPCIGLGRLHLLGIYNRSFTIENRFPINSYFHIFGNRPSPSYVLPRPRPPPRKGPRSRPISLGDQRSRQRPRPSPSPSTRKSTLSLHISLSLAGFSGYIIEWGPRSVTNQTQLLRLGGSHLRRQHRTGDGVEKCRQRAGER